MKNLAIIPARAGSKGLKNKNIKLICGKPLLAYSIEAAKNSELFDEIMVSTDSLEYSKIATQWGANVPFLRSFDLSSDNASTWDAVKDVLKNYKMVGKEFDTVTLLQPTSPLRNSDDIINGYKLMIDNDANFIVTLCEVDHSPLWTNTLPVDNSMSNFIRSDFTSLPRQKLPTYYRINGALYIVKVDYLMKTSDIYAEKSYASIMKKENSIDIDDEFDFKIAEILISEIQKKERNKLI